MKRVVGYIRVSSEEQVKGFSLKSQKDKIENYAEYKGWKIIKFYTDAGISGTSVKKRKGFNDMIENQKKGESTGIIVTKFDRAFRNVVDALNTIDELNKSNIDFISISEDIDTTSPMGRALFTIVGVFAELEAKRNSERVRDVRLNQFERGVVTGRCPYGYKPVFKDKKQKKGIIKIIPDGKRAEIVKKVFLYTLDGKGYKYICDELNIKPQSYYNILKNKAYIGIVSFEGQEKQGIHEPLISKEVFDKVNGK